MTTINHAFHSFHDVFQIVLNSQVPIVEKAASVVMDALDDLIFKVRLSSAIVSSAVHILLLIYVAGIERARSRVGIS